jgi:hypothetical protein
MTHFCAGCSLRFVSLNELNDHITHDHLAPVPVEDGPEIVRMHSHGREHDRLLFLPW